MKKVMTLCALAALVAITGCNEKKEAAKDIVSFDEVLTTRRSVRSYDASKKISETEVRELLTATQEAPSWANQQPTKYYVAISDEKVAAVQDMVGGNKERIKDAPVLIVSTFERGKSGFFQGNQTNEVGRMGRLRQWSEQLLPDSEGSCHGLRHTHHGNARCRQSS